MGQEVDVREPTGRGPRHGPILPILTLEDSFAFGREASGPEEGCKGGAGEVGQRAIGLECGVLTVGAEPDKPGLAALQMSAKAKGVLPHIPEC